MEENDDFQGSKPHENNVKQLNSTLDDLIYPLKETTKLRKYLLTHPNCLPLLRAFDTYAVSHSSKLNHSDRNEIISKLLYTFSKILELPEIDLWAHQTLVTRRKLANALIYVEATSSNNEQQPTNRLKILQNLMESSSSYEVIYGFLMVLNALSNFSSDLISHLISSLNLKSHQFLRFSELYSPNNIVYPRFQITSNDHNNFIETPNVDIVWPKEWGKLLNDTNCLYRIIGSSISQALPPHFYKHLDSPVPSKYAIRQQYGLFLCSIAISGDRETKNYVLNNTFLFSHYFGNLCQDHPIDAFAFLEMIRIHILDDKYINNGAKVKLINTYVVKQLWQLLSKYSKFEKTEILIQEGLEDKKKHSPAFWLSRYIISICVCNPLPATSKHETPPQSLLQLCSAVRPTYPPEHTVLIEIFRSYPKLILVFMMNTQFPSNIDLSSEFCLQLGFLNRCLALNLPTAPHIAGRIFLGSLIEKFPEKDLANESFELVNPVYKSASSETFFFDTKFCQLLHKYLSTGNICNLNNSNNSEYNDFLGSLEYNAHPIKAITPTDDNLSLSELVRSCQGHICPSSIFNRSSLTKCILHKSPLIVYLTLSMIETLPWRLYYFKRQIVSFLSDYPPSQLKLAQIRLDNLIKQVDNSLLNSIPDLNTLINLRLSFTKFLEGDPNIFILPDFLSPALSSSNKSADDTEDIEDDDIMTNIKGLPQPQVETISPFAISMSTFISTLESDNSCPIKFLRQKFYIKWAYCLSSICNQLDLVIHQTQFDWTKVIENQFYLLIKDDLEIQRAALTLAIFGQKGIHKMCQNYHWKKPMKSFTLTLVNMMTCCYRNNKTNQFTQDCYNLLSKIFSSYEVFHNEFFDELSIWLALLLQMSGSEAIIFINLFEYTKEAVGRQGKIFRNLSSYSPFIDICTQIIVNKTLPFQTTEELSGLFIEYIKKGMLLSSYIIKSHPQKTDYLVSDTLVGAHESNKDNMNTTIDYSPNSLDLNLIKQYMEHTKHILLDQEKKNITNLSSYIMKAYISKLHSYKKISKLLDFIFTDNVNFLILGFKTLAIDFMESFYLVSLTFVSKHMNKLSPKISTANKESHLLVLNSILAALHECLKDNDSPSLEKIIKNTKLLHSLGVNILKMIIEASINNKKHLLDLFRSYLALVNLGNSEETLSIITSHDRQLYLCPELMNIFSKHSKAITNLEMIHFLFRDISIESSLVSMDLAVNYLYKTVDNLNLDVITNKLQDLMEYFFKFSKVSITGNEAMKISFQPDIQPFLTNCAQRKGFIKFMNKLINVEKHLASHYNISDFIIDKSSLIFGLQIIFLSTIDDVTTKEELSTKMLPKYVNLISFFGGGRLEVINDQLGLQAYIIKVMIDQFSSYKHIRMFENFLGKWLSPNLLFKPNDICKWLQMLKSAILKLKRENYTKAKKRKQYQFFGYITTMDLCISLYEFDLLAKRSKIIDQQLGLLPEILVSPENPRYSASIKPLISEKIADYQAAFQGYFEVITNQVKGCSDWDITKYLIKKFERTFMGLITLLNHFTLDDQELLLKNNLVLDLINFQETLVSTLDNFYKDEITQYKSHELIDLWKSCLCCLRLLDVNWKSSKTLVVVRPSLWSVMTALLNSKLFLKLTHSILGYQVTFPNSDSIAPKASAQVAQVTELVKFINITLLFYMKRLINHGNQQFETGRNIDSHYQYEIVFGHHIHQLIPLLLRHYNASTSSFDRLIRDIIFWEYKDHSSSILPHFVENRSKEKSNHYDKKYSNWLQLDPHRLQPTIDEYYCDSEPSTSDDDNKYDISYLIPYITQRLRIAYLLHQAHLNKINLTEKLSYSHSEHEFSGEYFKLMTQDYEHSKYKKMHELMIDLCQNTQLSKRRCLYDNKETNVYSFYDTHEAERQIQSKNFIDIYSSEYKEIDSEGIWLKSFALGGALQITLISLNSQTSTIREMAFECISLYLSLLQFHFYKAKLDVLEPTARGKRHRDTKKYLRFPFKELPFLYTILKSFGNTLSSMNNIKQQPLSAPINLFVASFIPIIFRSESPLFPLINRFVLSRPNLDPCDIPLFYNLIQSTRSESFQIERKWLLEVLKNTSKLISCPVHCTEHNDSIELSQTMQAYRRRYVFPHLLSMTKSNSQNEKFERSQIIQIILNSTSNLDRLFINFVQFIKDKKHIILPDSFLVARQLLLNNNLLEWIEKQLPHLDSLRDLKSSKPLFDQINDVTLALDRKYDENFILSKERYDLNLIQSFCKIIYNLMLSYIYPYSILTGLWSFDDIISEKTEKLNSTIIYHALARCFTASLGLYDQWNTVNLQQSITIEQVFDQIHIHKQHLTKFLLKCHEIDYKLTSSHFQSLIKMSSEHFNEIYQNKTNFDLLVSDHFQLNTDIETKSNVNKCSDGHTLFNATLPKCNLPIMITVDKFHDLINIISNILRSLYILFGAHIGPTALLHLRKIFRKLSHVSDKKVDPINQFKLCNSIVANTITTNKVDDFYSNFGTLLSHTFSVIWQLCSFLNYLGNTFLLTRTNNNDGNLTNQTANKVNSGIYTSICYIKSLSRDLSNLTNDLLYLLELFVFQYYLVNNPEKIIDEKSLQFKILEKAFLILEPNTLKAASMTEFKAHKNQIETNLISKDNFSEEFSPENNFRDTLYLNILGLRLMEIWQTQLLHDQSLTFSSYIPKYFDYIREKLNLNK